MPPVWRRRLVIVGGLGLIVGLIALATVALVARDDGNDEPTWDAIAVLDEDAGRIGLYGPDGEQRDRIDTGLDDVTSFDTRGGHALVQYEGGDRLVALVDLESGDVDELDVDTDDHDVGWATTTDAPVVVVTDPDVGNVTLIDAISGTIVDVAETAGLTSAAIDGDEILSSADGRVFAMTDRNSFQTVLIHLESDEPMFVPPGELVAMSDETVMTLQRTGETGDLTFTSLDGERNAPAQVPTPVAVDLVDANTAVLATEDGRVLRVSSGDRDPDVLVDLDEELSAESPEGNPVRTTATADADDDTRVIDSLIDAVENAGDPDGPSLPVDELTYLDETDRIVVEVADVVFVLSADGDVIIRFDDHEFWRSPDHDDRCISIVSHDERIVRLLDAGSGDELLDADRGTSRSPISWSDDGCTLDTSRVPSTVLQRDGVTEPDGRVIEIAPDGAGVATIGDNGTIAVIMLYDSEVAPLELDGDTATFVTFSGS